MKNIINGFEDDKFLYKRLAYLRRYVLWVPNKIRFLAVFFGLQSVLGLVCIAFKNIHLNYNTFSIGNYSGIEIVSFIEETINFLIAMQFFLASILILMTILKELAENKMVELHKAGYVRLYDDEPGKYS